MGRFGEGVVDAGPEGGGEEGGGVFGFGVEECGVGVWEGGELQEACDAGGAGEGVHVDCDGASG